MSPTERRDRYGLAYPYSYRCDVENPMLVPDLSGRLKDHFQPCAECGEFHDERWEPEEDECEERGQRRWGSWYGEDRGLCGTCGAENAIVAAMYEDQAGDERAWVCLVCYVRHHKEDCGCALWAWAEKRLAIFLVE